MLVTNLEQLKSVDEETEYIFGSFARKHLPYELVRNDTVPSLVDMTKAALKILKNAPEGFVLMVNDSIYRQDLINVC